MILEIAEIHVVPGSEHEFEAAVKDARPLFVTAKGCHGIELQHCIERPQVYLLLVQWESVEDHTVIFRSSPAFARWRELVSPFFVETPRVQHMASVMTA